MEIGRHYERSGKWIAAQIRFQNVVDNYETTSHAPEALYRLTETSLALGIPAEAVKYAAVLGANYPGNDWYDKAYELVHSLLAADEKVLEDPAPFVALASLGDNSVNLVVRAWVKAPDYWEVHFRMNDQVYRQFAARGLSIPFPQLDVHLHEA